MAVENYQIKGILSFLQNSFLFLTPLWLIYLLAFPTAFKKNTRSIKSPQATLIIHLIPIVLLVMITIVLIFKVAYVKDRWLQPILFTSIFYFLLRVNPKEITQKSKITFLSSIFLAAMIIYTAFTIRVVGASLTDSHCRLNYPFTDFARDIRKTGFTDGLIISDNRFLAGNLHFQFPKSTAIIPKYKLENLPSAKKHTSTLIAWKADRSTKPPAKLTTFLKNSYNFHIKDNEIVILKKPLQYDHDSSAKIATIYLPYGL